MRHFRTTDSGDLALQMARYRVHKIRRFFTNLFIFAFVVLLYVAKTYFGAPFYFWPVNHIGSTFMLIWALVIAIMGVRLFFREMVFGINWEQRKMQEFMGKGKQNKWS